MKPAPRALRIIAYATRHHTGDARRVKELQYIQAPVGHHSRSKSELYARGSSGRSAMALYHELVQLSSQMPVRGVLARRSGPLTLRWMSDEIGVKPRVLKDAIELLTAPEEGDWHPWLDYIPFPTPENLIARHTTTKRFKKRDYETSYTVAWVLPEPSMQPDAQPDNQPDALSGTSRECVGPEVEGEGEGEKCLRTARSAPAAQPPSTSPPPRSGTDAERQGALEAVARWSGGIGLADERAAAAVVRSLGGPLDVGQPEPVSAWRLVELAARDLLAKSDRKPASGQAVERALMRVADRCIAERCLPGEFPSAVPAGGSSSLDYGAL